ncbi:small, acid-soluble spore protein, alpha/beta type [Anaerocolumna sedimenticola]|uniref:Small, acid-soluble spore protein, alpha/beta type n=1 Tax=Anaerocolumna sedimenticola TaxID=2696063 RepID=A0A6P1TQW5_9FIRM|nr:alpha/beta-type small acid-soluble spore protein [Anaerocolumna sedimenticola]QHQ63334.1 small, acid-soluble spore protein, alpha/beta type [Anaerocolumna sedimenticola]
MSKRTNLIPEARAALEQLKYEIANETGIPIKNNATSEMTSYQYGYMVKKMIEAQKKQMEDESKKI